MKRKKLILIDGLSLAFRAFFALPPTLTNKEGLPTNAIYGFTNMLLKVIEDEKPDSIAVAFDRPEPTFRDKIYKEYKAKRPPVPKEFLEQEPYIKKIVQALEIPIVEEPGYEADDIIGTLAKKAEKKGFEVLIVTGDLDTLQLVSQNVKVLTTKRGITDTLIYDETSIKQRWGLNPEQLIDFKALRGDPSDNIPGVSGIGEKTALVLISRFGSLENIFKKIREIEPESIRKKIIAGKETAFLSKRLCKIETEVPVKFDFEKEIYTFPPRNKEFLELFEKLDFKSLLKKYSSNNTYEIPQKILKEKTKYVVVKTDFELEKIIKKIKEKETFAFDLETTSLNPFEAKILGIAFTTETDNFFLPLEKEKYLQILKKIQPLMNDEKIKKITHNGKFEIEILLKQSIEIKGHFFDTMIASYLINPERSRYRLKDLAKEFLGKESKTYEELLESNKTKLLAEIPEKELAEYATSDSENTYQLFKIFKKELQEKNLIDLFEKIEMPLVEVLAEMELNGVKIDAKKLKKISEELSEKIKILEKEIFCLAGEKFNINSPQQLSKILFEKLKIPALKRTKTGSSTGADVLEKLASEFEIAQKILEYRTYSKIKSTYTDSLPNLINPKTGRVHTSFNQTATATGRLSSSNPNLQNIPIRTEVGQKIREAFIAEKDFKILSFDYSQIELRILAHFSGDKKLIEAFKNDLDIHAATASQIFKVPLEEVTQEMRRAAKTINFGIIYGMGALSLAESLKISRAAAQEYINDYFENYHDVREYLNSILESAREKGYVETLFGRRRYFPEIAGPASRYRSFAERAAINTPLQGTAADIIKLAMVKIHNLLKEKKTETKMILQVHDELVFEAPDKEITAISKEIKKIMEEIVKLKVPLKVSIGFGNNWAEAG